MRHSYNLSYSRGYYRKPLGSICNRVLEGGRGVEWLLAGCSVAYQQFKQKRKEKIC